MFNLEFDSCWYLSKACCHMASSSKEFTAAAPGRSDDSLPDDPTGGAPGFRWSMAYFTRSHSVLPVLSRFWRGGDSDGEDDEEEETLSLLLLEESLDPLLEDDDDESTMVALQ